MLTLTISSGEPTNVAEWNSLASQNGNLLQSTFYDGVQKYYRQEPVYFEVRDTETLMAGLKLYLWESRKIGPLSGRLSRRATQFGEFLLAENQSLSTIEVKECLSKKVEEYFSSKGIVSCSVGGYYGDERLLLGFPSAKIIRRSKFRFAYINLNQPEDLLWANLADNHKWAVRKAAKQGLKVTEEENFIEFFRLLGNSYSDNSDKEPNHNYLEVGHNHLHQNGHSTMFFVKNNEHSLGVAVVDYFGGNAYYSFGGTERNNLGAGNCLHWEIIRTLSSRGLKKYYLGMVARENETGNERFSVGISNFKRKFGVVEVDSCNTEYIFNERYDALWQGMKKMYQLNR
jgi:Acetyltransferase (GNAT) domain